MAYSKPSKYVEYTKLRYLILAIGALLVAGFSVDVYLNPSYYFGSSDNSGAGNSIRQIPSVSLTDPAVKKNQPGDFPSIAGGSNPSSTLSLAEIVHEEIGDNPVQGYIRQCLVLSGDIQMQSLGVFLNQHYQSLLDRRLKYHDRPKSILLFVFKDRESFEVGSGSNWLARLDFDEGEALEIEYKEKAIDALHSEPEVKFGYAEEERKSIFFELLEAERRGTLEAESAYFNNKENLTKEELFEMVELKKDLWEKYQKPVREKYGLTENQEVEITREALEKGWF